MLIDHLKLLRSAQKELEKETTRTQDSDIYGMHNGTNDDELPSVSEGEEHSTTPSSEEGIVADVSSNWNSPSCEQYYLYISDAKSLT